MSPKPRDSKPPPSVPPPSSRIPGRSASNAPYLLGIVALAGATVALVSYWRCSRSETAPETPATAPSSKVPPPSFLDRSPPAPPTEEELADAGPDASASASASVSASASAKTSAMPGGPVAGGGVCGSCGSGENNATLAGAVRSQAGLARGCYQKALRDDAAPTGTLTVAVSVGADGSVCGTSIVSDTVGSSAIASCVLGKFQGRTYPRPTSGCVVLQVPIAFAAK